MTSYGSQWLFGLGRLQPGIDVSQAIAEAGLVSDGIRERAPGRSDDREFYIERAGQLLAGVRRSAMPIFFLLLTITVLVLLTACANIANLMLARASARGREIGTRLAIGAGRGRMVRQLMTESLLLALTGGLLGLGLAAWAGRHIASFRLPLPLPVDLSLSVDHRVVLFSLALAVTTAIAFGLAPAFRATRTDLMGAMRSDTGQIASLRRFGLRNALVVAQVAISAVLVICSGLFLRSLDGLRDVDLGMDPQDVALVRFDPALNHYSGEETERLLLDVLRDTEALPGVRSASLINRMPLSLGGNNTRVRAEGSAEELGSPTAVVAVGPRYFETMGIPLLAGVEFGAAPSSEPMVIVNEELAGQLFPNQNAVGRYILGPRSYNPDEARQARIVAVAANTKFAMVQESEATPILYKPIIDTHGEEPGFGGLTLLVKTARDPGPLAEIIRRRLLSRDPELVVNLAGTMELHVQESLFVPRLAASLFGLCGVMGLLIASIGVYGVISFAVARRAREIGIRMALGARSSQVLRMVLWHGAALALVGIVVGVAGGLALARVAGTLIHGVSTSDPVTFISVPLVLLAVTLLATAIPAWRAAMLDPNQTLRAE